MGERPRRTAEPLADQVVVPVKGQRAGLVGEQQDQRFKNRVREEKILTAVFIRLGRTIRPILGKTGIQKRIGQ